MSTTTKHPDFLLSPSPTGEPFSYVTRLKKPTSVWVIEHDLPQVAECISLLSPNPDLGSKDLINFIADIHDEVIDFYLHSQQSQNRQSRQ